MTATTPQSPTHRRRWWVLSVLCLSALLMVVANMALNVALPDIARDLNATSTGLAWIVDSYVLCFAGLLLPAGALGDRFGRTRVLQIGLLVFLLAAVAGALSQHTAQLIAARSVMGVGAALVTPGTLAILAHVFPPAERARAIGIWAAVAGASVAVSLTASGVLLAHFRWTALFVGMAAVAAVAFVAGAAVLPRVAPGGTGRVDVAGALTSVLGVGGLLYALIQAPERGWTDTGVLAGAALGVAGLGAFLAVERRTARPMLQLRLFRNPAFSLGAVSIAAAYFALFGMYFLLTQYLQLVRGYSALQAGVCALPAGLAQFVVATAATPVVARYGIRTALSAGLFAAAAGLGLLAASRTAGDPWPVELGLALVGTGIGLTMPPATGAIMTSLPPSQAGVGSAVNNLVRELGGAFGIGLLGSVALLRYQQQLAGHGLPAAADSGLSQGLAAARDGAAAGAVRHAFVAGFDLAMLAGAAAVLLCAITAWRRGTARTPGPVPATQHRPQPVGS